MLRKKNDADDEEWVCTIRKLPMATKYIQLRILIEHVLDNSKVMPKSGLNFTDQDENEMFRLNLNCAINRLFKTPDS